MNSKFLHQSSHFLNNKTMFVPPLCFYDSFDQTYIEDDTIIIETLRNLDNIESLSDENKKKLLSKFGVSSNNLKLSKEEQLKLNQEKTLKINKFLHRNYDFEKAKKQLIKCLAFIKLSRDLLNSNIDDKFIKSAKVTDFYFKKYDFPFTWMSSNSLYHSFYPLVYKAKSIREHCIFLCWRLVFLSLEKVSQKIDFHSNISSIIANSSDKISDESNQTKYLSIKKYLFLSIILLKEIIPCQMIQYAGSIKNFEKTSGAMMIPELNPHVVQSYFKLSMCLLQKCFFDQILSHHTCMLLKESSEVVVKCIIFHLNHKNYDMFKSQDKTETSDVDNLTQKKIYSECIDVFINMCYDNEEVLSILGGMFALSYEVVTELKNNCWHHHLEDPFYDINHKNDQDDMLISKDSIFLSYKIRKYFNSPSQKKKNMCLIEIYKRLLPSLTTFNHFLATCIYIECLFSCYEISKIDLDDEIALSHLINLTYKVEMLFLPHFNMRSRAMELMAWIINNTKTRSLLCEKIQTILDVKNSSDQFETGFELAFIWRLIRKEININESISMPNIKKMISSVFTTNVSNGKKIASEDIKKAYRNVVEKKKYDSDEADANEFTQFDVDDDDFQNPSSSSSNESNRKNIFKPNLNIPFDKNDLEVWSILVGYFVDVNNNQKNHFEHIEKLNFPKMPASIFIPKSNKENGFNQEYLDMLISIVQNVNQKAILLKS